MLDRGALGACNAYNPGLSGAWMLQRAMSVRPGQAVQPDFINSLLAKNFAAMQRFGDPVLKPFLQVGGLHRAYASPGNPGSLASRDACVVLHTFGGPRDAHGSCHRMRGAHDTGGSQLCDPSTTLAGYR